MKLRQAAMAMAVTAGLAAGAGAARADVLVATFGGTLVGGQDLSAVFGLHGADLAGQAFVLTATYDTALGLRNTDAVSDRLSPNGSSPFVSEVLTINGVDYGFHQPPIAGFVEARATPPGETTFTVVSTNAPDQQFDISFASLDTPLSVATPFSLSDNALDCTATVACGQFQILLDSPATTGFTSGQFQVSSLQVSEQGGGGGGGGPGVPEPASWALMLLGFGGLGAALRARRQRVFA